MIEKGGVPDGWIGLGSWESERRLSQMKQRCAYRRLRSLIVALFVLCLVIVPGAPHSLKIG